MIIISEPMMCWIIAFFETQFIEVFLGLSILIVWLHLTQELSWSHSLRSVFRLRVVSILCLASALTHPPLWFILPSALHLIGIDSYFAYLIIGELAVFLIEAWWYQKMLQEVFQETFQETFQKTFDSWYFSLGFSLILNLTSASYGLWFASSANT